jgi:hypothetical protein
MHLIANLLIAVIIPQIIGLTILSPSSVSKHVSTPRFNHFVGYQGPVAPFAAQLAFIQFHECNDDMIQESRFAGKIALLSNPFTASRKLSEEHSTNLCLERAGAIGVVRMLENYGQVG